MRSSTIYNFIQVYKAPNDSAHYKFKTSQEGKPYYFCPMVPSATQLSLGGQQYQVVNQHLSVYSEYNDNVPGMEAYHLTVKLNRNGQEFVAHCYYDISGNPTVVQSDVKLTPEDRKQLHNYGQQAVGKISGLNQELLNKENALLADIKKQEEIAEKFDPNQIRELNKYIKELRKLAKLIAELNFITNQSQAGKQKIVEQMLATCEMRLAARQLPAKRKRSEVPNEKLETRESTQPQQPEPKEKKADEAETLASVNQKLALLLKGKIDLANLQELKRLLELKLKLIPSSDFKAMIAVFRKLQKLCDQIPECMLQLALEGDVKAAENFVANNYRVTSYKNFIDLVNEGREEIFDILSKNSPYAILLKEGSFHFEVDSRYFQADLLTLAYENGHKSFFRTLLFTHHVNPDIRDATGRTLIYRAVAEGEMEYAQMLHDAGAELNVKPQKGLGRHLAILDEDNDQSEKKQIMKRVADQLSQPQQIENISLLIEAARFRRDQMLQWLATLKVDASVRAEHGLDAMGIYLSKKGSPVDPATVLALLKAGMTVDVINKFATGETCNPLHYACQWLDENLVRLLVTRFAADPNVMVKKRFSVRTPNSNEQTEMKLADSMMLMDCLTSLSGKYFEAQRSQRIAAKILLFLLNQDIRPVIRQSLMSCIKFFENEFHVNTVPLYAIPEDELFTRRALAAAAVLSNDYGKFLQIMKEIINTCISPIYKALQLNLLKLDFIQMAEEHLAKKEYQECLDVCYTTFRAQFTTEQYNERLWAACYQAHLALGDDEMAFKTLRRYLIILKDKARQVSAPKYKSEINKKIETASAQLAEIQQRLKFALPVRAATMPFVAELKEQNMKKLANKPAGESLQPPRV